VRGHEFAEIVSIANIAVEEQRFEERRWDEAAISGGTSTYSWIRPFAKEIVSRSLARS